jgi:hypothetical protein
MTTRPDEPRGPEGGFRYWKVKEFRKTMTPQEVEGLEGEHPAGEMRFPDEVVLVSMMPERSTTKVCYSARTEIQGCSCPK